MAEVMQRMADKAALELQATERKLCEKLNALAAALLASSSPPSEPQAQTQPAGHASAMGDEPMDTASPKAGPSGGIGPSNPVSPSRKRKHAGLHTSGLSLMAEIG